ncbi:MAG: hypothetical protein JXA19_00345 [Anaerolineales bacterium]|nr:hypothetical protein [Anaerolineales bacterium]
MPRVKCNYNDCVFNEDEVCTSSVIKIDLDEGCMTYKAQDEVGFDVSDWDDDIDISDDDIDIEDEEEDDDDWGDAGFEELDDEDDEEIWMENEY